MRGLRAFLALLAASLAFAVLAPVAEAAEVDLHTSLNGSSNYPKATGSSEYDRGDDGREVEVTVRSISGLAGKRVSVYVSGTKVGTMLVRSTGVAHREWDTEKGDTVPFASAGDYVKVRTGGGTLVASGRYVRSAED